MPSLLRVSCVPLVNPQLLSIPWGGRTGAHTPAALPFPLELPAPKQGCVQGQLVCGLGLPKSMPGTVRSYEVFKLSVFSGREDLLQGLRWHRGKLGSDPMSMRVTQEASLPSLGKRHNNPN